MASRKHVDPDVEQLEHKIGLLLEQALDLAVARPPDGPKARLKHLADIRDAAADAVTLASAALVLLSQKRFKIRG